MARIVELVVVLLTFVKQPLEGRRKQNESLSQKL